MKKYAFFMLVCLGLSPLKAEVDKEKLDECCAALKEGKPYAMRIDFSDQEEWMRVVQQRFKNARSFAMEVDGTETDFCFQCFDGYPGDEVEASQKEGSSDDESFVVRVWNENDEDEDVFQLSNDDDDSDDEEENTTAKPAEEVFEEDSADDARVKLKSERDLAMMKVIQTFRQNILQKTPGFGRRKTSGV